MPLKIRNHNPNESIFLAAQCEMLCDARFTIATIPEVLAYFLICTHECVLLFSVIPSFSGHSGVLMRIQWVLCMRERTSRN